MRSTKPKAIPNVGDYVRQEGRLRKVTTYQAPLPAPVTYYIFEDINARIELRRKGRKVKDYGTQTDFYGEGTSITNAIKDAKKYAKHEEIDANSEMEFVVIKVIDLHARLVNKYDDNFYNEKLVAFEYDKGLPLEVGESLGESREEVVWSSKKDSLED